MTLITASKSKKPVLKKKVAETDPFASDEDEIAGPPAKDSIAGKAAGMKRTAASRDQDEDEEQRPKKKGGI